MSEALEVVGLGAMNLDLVYQVERMVADGEAGVVEHTRSPGGSAANTIYGLACLGVRTGFLGAVGEDEAGRMLLESFRQVGVDTRGVVHKQGAETGFALCLADSRGRRALYVYLGANALLKLEDIDLSALAGARLLHMSSFLHEEQFVMQQELVSHLPLDIQFSFAPGALYARKGLQALSPILERTSFLFLNQQEVRDLTGQSFPEGVEALLKAGCRQVVVTLGRGFRWEGRLYACLVAGEGGRLWVTAGKVDRREIKDTIGAGDAFAAGYLFGLLRGQAPEDCARLGETMASLSLRCPGARSGLPDRGELAAALGQRYGLALD